MSIVGDSVQAESQTAVPLGPESWEPGSEPDPLIRHERGSIGAPVSRLDGALKVTGAARFAAEVRLEGMVYAALVFSTIAKGRLATIDTGAAEEAPGVVLVMTHRNAPRMNPSPLLLTSEKAAGGDDLPVMQDDRIHWNGQPIALVLAETQEQADHAVSLIRATYEIEEATTAFEQAKLHARPALFGGEPLSDELGDAEAALAAAPYSVDVTYRTPFQNHNAIEPHAATVAWDGDELIVHDASQGVTHMAWSLADIFDLEEDQVHVTASFVGGAFGGKTMWQHHVLGAAASRLASRPVRIALSREGVYRVVGGRTATEQRVALGATADGRFQSLIHTGTVAMTRHNNVPEPFILPARCLYAADNLKLGVHIADLDMLANTFMRAPGESVGSFALECAIDELAERIGIDPIELRIRNEPDADPISGKAFSSRHLVEAFRMGAERFGWSKRDPKPGARREGEWLIGMGCATATYPYHRFPGGAARITLTRDGRATVEVAAHEAGMGTATVQTQVTAERLGLPLEQVTFAYGDSSFPGVILAGGSQQAASIGGAVIAAHRKLVTELLELADIGSPLAGLSPNEVGGIDGGLCKLDEPERRESYASILAGAQRDEVSVEAVGPPPVEMAEWSMHSFGAQFCEARVNTVTGETRISRFLSSVDCGRVLNSKL
ncbi:MAG TPA: xanthine dehydrogenase family protein molybdopterin-binding subunit, partial [Gaiellaceae bacterium]|nr:xanthine dehydrogenase family protein molybdopterin-binding subunit [Gaiellaceae bacterium]